MNPAAVSALDGSSWLAKVIETGEPSSAGPLLARSAVGATFATSTCSVAVVDDRPSERLTVIV